MTCEDDDERIREGLLETVARRFASLLSSGPIRMLTRFLPREMRRAMATVLLTAADVLRR